MRTNLLLSPQEPDLDANAAPTLPDTANSRCFEPCELPWHPTMMDQFNWLDGEDWPSEAAVSRPLKMPSAVSRR
jgi:hypothetical protein